VTCKDVDINLSDSDQLNLLKSLPLVTIPVRGYEKLVTFFYGTCEFQGQDIPSGPVSAAALPALPTVSGYPSEFY
jgi:hypothetical protein